MKKNWWVSTIVMGTIAVVTFVYAEFIGFDLKVESLATLGSVKVHFVGLFSRTFNNFDVVLSNKKYSFYYLAMYTREIQSSYGIFDVLTSHIFELIWSLIAVSLAGFIYSISMCFNTDKFDFYSELTVGIFYAIFAIAVIILGVLVFVSWFEYVKNLHLISPYSLAPSGKKDNLSSSYVGPIVIMSLTVLPAVSYSWKLITLLKSE